MKIVDKERLSMYYMPTIDSNIINKLSSYNSRLKALVSHINFCSHKRALNSSLYMIPAELNVRAHVQNIGGPL